MEQCAMNSDVRQPPSRNKFDKKLVRNGRL